MKPIVVSTERPSSTALTEQPLPRWQTTSRRQRSAPRIRVGLLVAPRDVEPVKAVAAQLEALAPLARQRVRRGLRRQRAVKGGVEAGDLRQARQRRGGRVDALERGARVQRRQRRERGDRGARVGVDARRPGEARPAVHDAVPDRLGAAARVGERRAQRAGVAAGARRPAPSARSPRSRIASVAASTSACLRLLEPALTTRTRTATATSRAPGQVQSRTSGMSSKCSRM